MHLLDATVELHWLGRPPLPSRAPPHFKAIPPPNPRPQRQRCGQRCVLRLGGAAGPDPLPGLDWGCHRLAWRVMGTGGGGLGHRPMGPSPAGTKSPSGGLARDPSQDSPTIAGRLDHADATPSPVVACQGSGASGAGCGGAGGLWVGGFWLGKRVPIPLLRGVTK